MTTIGAVDINRLRAPLERIIREASPKTAYLGAYEYVVVDSNDEKVDARVIDESTGMPDLSGIPYRSSPLGEKVTIAEGTLVTVMFINGSPSRPVVVGADHDPASDDAHIRSGEVSIEGASMPTNEHAISTEAVVNLFVNFIYLLAAAGVTNLAGVGKLIDPTDPSMALMTSALTAWIAASMLPAAPAGATPGGMLLPGITNPISLALAAKLPNVLGTIPGIGCKGIKIG